MPELVVNVDHIATLRQARNTSYPDPVAAAALAELAGAHGIVVHLRGDRRHIQDRDVRILRETVQSRLTLEMAATPEMLEIALEIKPDAVTLVPEKKEELTTEGGLDMVKNNVSEYVNALKNAEIPVCIFIDPNFDQIKAAHAAGADMIEIHTGAFCDAKTKAEGKKEFATISEAASFAARLNLIVNAGHGICYNTIRAFKQIKEIHEFSIGHSIISRASLVGIQKAVKEMLWLMG